MIVEFAGSGGSNSSRSISIICVSKLRGGKRRGERGDFGGFW